MQARMSNPAFVVPDAMHALQALGKAVRNGGVPAKTLELVHRGHSRDSYARGALLAAKFLAEKPPGRYTMKDVLGL